MEVTYKSAGVDIDVANKAKVEMAKELNTADKSGRVLNTVGAFASLYDFNDIGVKHPILVLKTEEPGTKQLLSFARKKVKNICYDMINHLVNDIIVMGATPLTVQDAIICGKLELDVVPQIVKYVSEACKENGCVLTGGETSEQPGMLKEGTYVLTSSIVGVVDKDNIIDGHDIQEGDIVIALASNGIHTNGYSFLRKMMEQKPDIEDCLIDGEKFIDVILQPHRSYYHAITAAKETKGIVGMAHITGGGIAGNLNRILPKELDAQVDLSQIKVLPIFKFIKNNTGTSDDELLKTFNMGVGMTIVVKKELESEIIQKLTAHDIDSYRIGSIVKGSGEVQFINNLEY